MWYTWECVLEFYNVLICVLDDAKMMLTQLYFSKKKMYHKSVSTYTQKLANISNEQKTQNDP